MEAPIVPSISTPLSPVPSPSTPNSSSVRFHRIYRRSRSFSSLEDLKLGEKLSFAGIDEEETMDMLWEEYFNAELSQVACNGGKKMLDFSMEASKLDGKGNDGRKLLCLNAVRHRQPRMVVILRALKKLFFVQKTREKRTASSNYDGFRLKQK